MTDDARRNGQADLPPSLSRPPATSSVEVIKADIERTQAELANTLEALQQRLHPRRLVDDARSAVKDYTSRRAHRALDATVHGAAVGAVYAARTGRRVRREMEARPASALLVASGLASLAWLWYSRRPRRRHE